MTVQFSTAVRNAILDVIESTIGASAKLRIYTGAMPANPAAAATGTLLADIALPADWMAGASGGVKALSSAWAVTAAAAGTPGYYRIVDNAGTTCHEQGGVSTQVQIPTTAATAANVNVLTFAATTGIVVGMNVTGPGIVSPTVVLATTGTTVTLSAASTAGVASGASIAFTQDLTLDAATVALGQTVTITAKSYNAPNA